MRYFAELAYNGTRYAGWQRQPKEETVQTTIEAAMSMLLRTEIFVTGCGRTDAGVHASYYVMHFDFDGDMPDDLIWRLNRVLGEDIVIYRIAPVHEKAHARYDAFSRTYHYYIDLVKNPFHRESAFMYIFPERIDFDKLQQTADLIKQYTAFAPFCKTHSGVKTMICHITHAQWTKTENQLVFEITANRFLRGMVRMIVGECLNHAIGKATLEDLKLALDNQTRLKKASPVAPKGLFLSAVKYPFVF